jgi:hypothetical protein
VELITYIPLLILVILFRKTKSFQRRSNNLRKSSQIIFTDESVDFKSKSKESNKNEETQKSFKFPWFFKIILYFILLFIIAFSNLFVLFKGNFQTSYKVNSTILGRDRHRPYSFEHGLPWVLKRHNFIP